MRHTLRVFFYIIFSLFFLQNSYSEYFSFRTFPQDKELSSPYISFIIQDSLGYLWFGTVEGINRFDGNEFKAYRSDKGLLSKYSTTALEDRHKQLWIGTMGGGIGCLSNGRIKYYSTNDGLPADTIISIAEDKNGLLWIGTENGLCSFDGTRFKTTKLRKKLNSNFINSISIDKKDQLWFATSDGLFHFSIQDPQGDLQINSISQGLLDNRVNIVYHDSKGNVWIGTPKGLNCLLEGKVLTLTTANGLVNNYVISINEDNSGKIWIGTIGGISILDSPNEVPKISNITTQNGLLSNFITKIIQDSEGNTWIATSKGVCYMRSFNIRTYSEKDGLINNLVNYIIEDHNNTYWLATENSISSFSNGIFKNYTLKDGLISNSINGIMADRKGSIWIVTAEGLSILSPATGKFTNYTTSNGLPTNVLFKSVELSDGSIWISTRLGIICYKDGRFLTPPFQSKGPVEFFLRDRKENIWFVSDSGLFVYSHIAQKLIHYNSQKGIPGDQIFYLFQDSKERIWVSTNKGVYRSEPGINKEIPANFKQVEFENGVQFKSCWAIQEDIKGNIWMSIPNGLVCFDGETVKTYDHSHGLTGDYWFSMLVDHKGTMWLGSRYGLTRFDPPPVRLNLVPPPIYITGVKILEKSVPLNLISTLSHDRNYIRFSFVGLCYSSPESVVYKYRLKGIDTEWLETKSRSLFYPYLPPGDYTFQVKAINNDHIESKTPAEISFSILPPFWNTWWFKTLAILLILSLLSGLAAWKFKRSREKLMMVARTRQLILSQRMELMGLLAASAVHDLKNLLSIIIGYSEIVSETYNHTDEISHHNENIKKTANTAVQLVKQILNLAKPKQDENDDTNLTDLMNNIMEILKVTSTGEIKINWIPPSENIYAYMNPIRVQQLVMNLCLNAIDAMPEGGELRVTLSRFKNNQISITISDTGSGIEPELISKIFDPLFTTKVSGKGSGLGLFVVKQIVEEYHGEIQVDSTPEKGTTFLVIFPVNNNNK